jgi:hypothetical protein|tara:strand:+ start:574 stop:1155 length:582 start_codon:yes stop_codon:yes gene_type:complete
MEIIIHRINSLKELIKLPTDYGAEIDIRSQGSRLILNHEPFKDGCNLINYIENYKHGTLILNIKESGIEEEVLKIVKSKPIKSYFLLDVEMPYIYFSSKHGNKNMAIRFSEYESLKTVEYFTKLVNWIWIDTVNTLPIKSEILPIISNFKSCIVCPERWGRKNDIKIYKKILAELNYEPNAVMTSLDCIKLWK